MILAHRRGCAGLSRVEVVLVLLIILSLLGLTLSAVHKMREAAARMSCSNNLKQLSLGIHNCYDTNRKLPALVDQGDGGRGLQSVFATLTPYLESAPGIYYPRSTNPTAYHAPTSVTFPHQHKDGTPGTMHGGAANQIIWRTFDCPSDATADRLQDVPMTLPDGTTGHYATGSYAVNGLLPWRTGELPATAGTILFGERPQVCRTATGETVYNLWGVGFYSPHMPAFATLTPAEPPDLWPTGQVAPVVPLPDEAVADRDAQIRVRIGTQSAAPQVPDFATPLQQIRSGRPCDPRLPGTPHYGVLPAAMGDGSVRTFSLNTSPWVFWTACVPAEPPARDAKGR